MRVSDSSSSKSSRKRTRVYGVLLAAVVAVASLVLAALTQPPKSAVSSPGPAKAAIVPQIADAKSEAEILVRGKSFAQIHRTVSMPYSGEILEIHVKEGQTLEKDEKLVTYKLSREAMKEVEAILFPGSILSLENAILGQETKIANLKEGSLPVAQLKVDRAKKELQDIKELADRGMAGSKAVKLKADQVEIAEKELVELNRSIRLAEVKLETMRKDLKYQKENRERQLDLLEWNTNRSYRKDSKLPHDIAYLTAPIAASVVWLNPELRVKAEPPRGFHSVRLAPMDPMVVRCKVHELDLVKLKPGDQATATFDALPDKQYKCSLTRIPLVSRNPSLEVPADYEVEALMPNVDGKIRDGMTCNVRVRIRQ